MDTNENGIVNVGQALDPVQVDGIAGGCTLDEILKSTSDLKESYDNLVDFTSYVIERILGK